MAATEFQAKITVAKILQLAYFSDRQATASIIYSGSNYSISVDQSGEVKLSGVVGGTIRFDGNPAINGLGLSVRRITISFTNGDGGIMNYTGSFSFVAGTQISVSGSLDVFELIKSCSGLLCRAARFLDGRDAQIEHELQQYVR